MGPKAKDPKVSAEEVGAVLKYDPTTGALVWRENRGGKAKIGTVAGCVNEHGYIRLLLMQRSVMAHRLVWLLKTGDWPDGEIDHIDGNRSNNRLENLRIATRAQNNRNRRSLESKRLPKGVSRNQRGDTYRVRIMVDRHLITVGNFKTWQLAADAYVEASKRHHGEFSRTE